jgi:hypothetical protein
VLIIGSPSAPGVSRALNSHERPPYGLSAVERDAWGQLDFFYKKGMGYPIEMNDCPQMLYGLTDSPIGQDAILQAVAIRWTGATAPIAGAKPSLSQSFQASTICPFSRVRKTCR